MKKRIVLFVFVLLVLSTMLFAVGACNHKVEDIQDWVAAFEKTAVADNFTINYSYRANSSLRFVEEGVESNESSEEVRYVKIIYDFSNRKFYYEERYGIENKDSKAINHDEAIRKVYIEVVGKQMVVYKYSKNNTAEQLWSATSVSYETNGEVVDAFAVTCASYYYTYLDLGLEMFYSQFSRTKSGKYTCKLTDTLTVTIGFAKDKIANYRLDTVETYELNGNRATSSSKATCFIKYSGHVRIPNKIKKVLEQ